eukprot:GHVR01059913.1.p1 GENE.GHVR01059913.1~~GHVR01059913.1.p1  ORF type:complete len:323 (+),score=59.39 GHVR01059913.1:45-971(+)
MKFGCILSLLTVVYSQLPDKLQYCVYNDKTCAKAVKCGDVTTCVNHTSDKGVKAVSNVYFEYTTKTCDTGTEVTDNKTDEVTDANNSACHTLANLSVSIQQEYMPERYCIFSGVVTCSDADKLSCGEIGTCMQYSVGKFAKVTDYKLTAYTDKNCSSPISNASSDIIRYGSNCKQAGNELVLGQGSTFELTNLQVSGPSASYLCGYSDINCTDESVIMCNKYADGCKMIAKDKYFKRNIYTNKIELHTTDKCDSWTAMSRYIPSESKCEEVGDKYYAKYSYVLLTTTSSAYTCACNIVAISVVLLSFL